MRLSPNYHGLLGLSPSTQTGGDYNITAGVAISD